MRDQSEIRNLPIDIAFARLGDWKNGWWIERGYHWIGGAVLLQCDQGSLVLCHRCLVAWIRPSKLSTLKPLITCKQSTYTILV